MSKIFKSKRNVLYLIIILAVLALIVYSVRGKEAGELDSFASCLEDSGAMFYGTTWCSYCQAQRDLFASSFKYAPYTECSLPGGSGTNPVCKKAGVTAYPTWIFASGEIDLGQKSLEYLANKTGCKLPS